MAQARADMRPQRLGQVRPGGMAACQADERLDHMAALGVRAAYHGGPGNGGMGGQRVLDLDRADAVAGALDQVVVAAAIPVVPVGIARIARSPVRTHFPSRVAAVRSGRFQ